MACQELVNLRYEVAVYLHNFHNLDLFHQGWYAIKIRTFWEDNPDFTGVPIRVQQYFDTSEDKHGAKAAWQILDADRSFRSHMFRIKYAHQDVPLQEMAAFRITLPRLTKSPAHALLLQFELLCWSKQNKEVPVAVSLDEPPDELECVASQSYRVMPSACSAIHAYCPLQFDSYHMALVDATVHAALIGVNCYNEKVALPPPLAAIKSGEGIPASTQGEAAQEASPSSDPRGADTGMAGQAGPTTSQASAADTDSVTQHQAPNAKDALDWRSRLQKAAGSGSWKRNLRSLLPTKGTGSGGGGGDSSSPEQFHSSGKLQESPEAPPVPAPVDYEDIFHVVDAARQGLSEQLAELQDCCLGPSGGQGSEKCADISGASGERNRMPGTEQQQREEEAWALAQEDVGVVAQARPELGGGTNSEAGGFEEGERGQAGMGMEEWQKRFDDATQQSADLWGAFLALHQARSEAIWQVLRSRWHDDRSTEWALWVVQARGSAPAEGALAATGVNGELLLAPRDKAGQWKEAHDPAAASAARAELHRLGLANLRCEHCPVQDLVIFGRPEVQPILFVERHFSLASGDQPTLVASDAPSKAEAVRGMQQGLADSRSTAERDPNNRRTSFDDLEVSAPGPSPLPPQPRAATPLEGRGPPKPKHLVVFVHGFQGHHLDLRLVRDHWLQLDPTIDTLMSETNEGGDFENLATMGGRLAEEVVACIESTFGTALWPNPHHFLDRLSFVGHSVGNLIIRAALTQDILQPYLNNLFTYVSISAPHLGYLYSSNSIFNGGLWLLKNMRRSPFMHQLTFSDEPSISDCFLYRLSQKRTLDLFRHVLLLASPQDRYVPYHSARVELCPGALKDSKRGAQYAEMVRGTLGMFLDQPLSEAGTPGPDGRSGAKLQRLERVMRRGKVLMRCDVNFDTTSSKKGAIDTIIGRKAHIDFLETDVYLRFLMWSYRDYFV